jgi:hypothetical protein
MSSETSSREFQGEYLYIDEGAKDPGKSCLQLSWQSDNFLRDAAPLMGKVSYLYVVPGHFKTKETSVLAIERVLALLDPWGNFYYRPCFREVDKGAPDVLLETFKNECLPLEVRFKGKSAPSIQEIFESSVCKLMARHFEKVTQHFKELGDGRLSLYCGERPLIHQEVLDPLSIRNIHKAFGPYFESKNPEHFICKPSYPLVLGRLCEEKKEALRRVLHIGGTIFLHPQGKQPLDVGYGLLFGWERAHENPFTLPLSWQDPALFKKLSPLEGKITHLFALPGRTACETLDLDKIEMGALMRLLTKDAVMLVEPLPRFVTADQNATIESLNKVTGAPLSYAVPDLPGVSSLTEKLNQTKTARAAFLKAKVYPRLLERLGAYFIKVEGLELSGTAEFDEGLTVRPHVIELLALRLTGVRQDF